MLVKIVIIGVVCMLLVTLALAAKDLLLGNDALGRRFTIRVVLSMLLLIGILVLDVMGLITPSKDLVYLRSDHVSDGRR
ncbi:hypothetical protein OAT84_00160 [Gammaproteobacteria bacterium]|nr:hypothetical protein [Gammaproteobacteria bacterium]